MYVSLRKLPPITLAMLVRTAQDPAVAVAANRDVIHSVDPDQPVYRVADDAIRRRRRDRPASLRCVAFRRVRRAVARTRGGRCLRSHRAIGGAIASARSDLRMALGADPSSVLRLIVRDALSLAAAGVVLGLVLALLLTRLLESQLFGVSARDPLVLGAIAPVLLIVAAAASYLPGRAASRLNPVSALRAD